jgi:hypothetical protein
LFEYWGKRDPIGLFEAFLIEDSLDLETGRRVKRTDGLRQRNAEVLRRSEQRVVNEVERAAEEALVSGRENMPHGESVADGVYAQAERETGSEGERAKSSRKPAAG